MTKKVLIVDDDQIIYSVIEATLKQAGYSTLIASNGMEAKQILEQTKPDLMTLDINMPELSGLQLLEMMRPTEYLDGVKIILVSGQPVDELIDVIVSGADWVFEKPLKPEQLVKKVAELIGAA
ncbi:MAG: response regulator [Gammaproteobacteria bacterium]|nr:response regulator [Gammaproteobacteria bacterium]